MIANIINGKVIEPTSVRESEGWTLPVTRRDEVAFALKAARSRRRGSFRETVQVLSSIGRDADWIGDADFRAVIESTGSTLKYLRFSIQRVNRWLAALEEALGSHGEVTDAGLRQGNTLLVGGVATSLVLAGDATALSPMALSHAMIAQGNTVVKGSSVEPLAPFLFLKAALQRGLQVPSLLFLDSTSEDGREAIRSVVQNSDQSVIYGEDRTILNIYRDLPIRPTHKSIGFWSGRSGVVVLDDADLELAARCIVEGAAEDRGNRCISTKKVYVASSRYSELRQLVVKHAEALRRGDPSDPETDIGRLFPEARMAALSAAAESEIFYDHDAIFAEARDGSALLREELPYPVVGFRPFGPDEDPVTLANASVSGTPSGRILALSVITRDDQAFERVVAHAHAFKVLQNRPTTYMNHAVPHQGIHLWKELMRPIAVIRDNEAP